MMIIIRIIIIIIPILITLIRIIIIIIINQVTDTVLLTWQFTDKGASRRDCWALISLG